MHVVPKTTRQVRLSPEEQFWIEADQSALDSILVRGNKLVRIDEVPAGVPIAPVVTARRIKVDQATGELEKFKSRHSVDGNRESRCCGRSWDCRHHRQAHATS